jgi:hypothetical protein
LAALGANRAKAGIAIGSILKVNTTAGSAGGITTVDGNRAATGPQFCTTSTLIRCHFSPPPFIGLYHFRLMLISCQ